MNETITNEITPVSTMINYWKNSDGTNPEIDLYEKNRELFDKFYNRISNFAEMDFNVELKSLKNKREELRHAQFNTNTQFQLSENIIKTNMMFNGNMIEELPNDTATYMEMLQTSPEEYMFGEQMRNLKDDITTDMNKLDLCIKICETLKNEKYGDSTNNTEISRLIEKLKNDIKMLESSSDLNKNLTIDNIKNAIELITSMDGKILTDTMYTDKRIYKLAKEVIKNEYKLIENIFGKDSFESFYSKMNTDYIKYELWACKIFLHHIAKKIESSMKAKDYKSLVYKSYIIHFIVETEPGSDEYERMRKIFGDIIEEYANNHQLHELFARHGAF